MRRWLRNWRPFRWISKKRSPRWRREANEIWMHVRGLEESLALERNTLMDVQAELSLAGELNQRLAKLETARLDKLTARAPEEFSQVLRELAQFRDGHEAFDERLHKLGETRCVLADRVAALERDVGPDPELNNRPLGQVVKVQGRDCLELNRAHKVALKNLAERTCDEDVKLEKSIDNLNARLETLEAPSPNTELNYLKKRVLTLEKSFVKFREQHEPVTSPATEACMMEALAGRVAALEARAETPLMVLPADLETESVTLSPRQTWIHSLGPIHDIDLTKPPAWVLEAEKERVVAIADHEFVGPNQRWSEDFEAYCKEQQIENLRLVPTPPDGTSVFLGFNTDGRPYATVDGEPWAVEWDKKQPAEEAHQVENEPLHGWTRELAWAPGVTARVGAQLRGDAYLRDGTRLAWRTILSLTYRDADDKKGVFTQAYKPGELQEDYLEGLCSKHPPSPHPLIDEFCKRARARGLELDTGGQD